MWLFVGLGNPGAKYERNRHNIGFMAIDKIAEDLCDVPVSFRKKHKGLYFEGRIAGEKIAFLKPETFMNNSGQSVCVCASFYKIAPDRIVVFHDELDLAPEQVRVKKGGGAAGHNGLKSIRGHLGTPDFWRVRIGIGHPGDRAKVSNYVLSDFAKSEQGWVDRVLNLFAKTGDEIIKGGPEAFAKKITEGK